jgi:hypothetical protein
MGAITRIVGTRTEALSTGLNSLAADTYLASSAIDCQADDPIDVLVDASVTPGTVTGDKALLVFVQVSSDGTNYSTGPTSGTSATDEPNLYLIGVVPCNTNSAAQRGVFSLFASLGFIPTDFKIVVRNRTGAALAASGHSVGYAMVTASVA